MHNNRCIARQDITFEMAVKTCTEHLVVDVDTCTHIPPSCTNQQELCYALLFVKMHNLITSLTST